MDRLDGLALLGLGLLNWGLWWIHPPLAPLVTGIILLGAVVWAAKGARRGNPDRHLSNGAEGER